MLTFDNRPLEFNLTEMPDLNMVRMITDRFDDINIPFTNPRNPKGDKIIGSGAKKMWKQYVDQLNDPVIYQSTTKGEPNRMYAKRISCQGLPSSFRNSLYQNVATDTDAVCCHPTIAKHMSDSMGLKCDFIDDYIENRDERLTNIAYALDWPRSRAKQLYNALLYGQEIPIEVKADEEIYDLIEGYKKQCESLADQVCLRFPLLLKEAQKKDKYKPKFSALSCFLNNIENQIVLKAMEWMTQRGIKIFVYCFDGFLHSKIDDVSIYDELNEYICKTTGIALRFINKKMEKFIPFSNLLEVHELAPKKPTKPEDIDFSSIMIFDFHVIEMYCSVFYEELIADNRNDFLVPLREYCDHFFVTIKNADHLVIRQSYRMVQGRKMVKGRVIMKYSSFIKTFCSDQNTILSYKPKDKIVTVPVFSLATNYMLWEQRQKYETIDFYPSIEPQPFYNVFTGFNYLPSGRVITEQDECVKLFVDHIKNIWCKADEALYYFTIRWLAWCIQKPTVRTESALVLKGVEGAGKGIIITHFMGGIIGDYDIDTHAKGSFRPIKNQDDVFGKFTGSALEGCCMLFLDELVWGGDKKSSGILKALITERTNKVEYKGKDYYNVRAFQNVIMSSNEKWVVPAGENTRRFHVMDCDNKYAGIPTPESVKYFDELLKVPIQDVCDLFHSMDLSDFNPKAVIMTDALEEQKTLSMDSSFLWLKDQLENPDGWAEYTKAQDISKAGIYERYSYWCKSTNSYRTLAENVFWKDLEFLGTKGVRKGVRGEQVRYVIFPEYHQAVELFTKRFNIKITLDQEIAEYAY